MYATRKNHFQIKLIKQYHHDFGSLYLYHLGQTGYTKVVVVIEQSSPP